MGFGVPRIAVVNYRPQQRFPILNMKLFKGGGQTENLGAQSGFARLRVAHQAAMGFEGAGQSRCPAFMDVHSLDEVGAAQLRCVLEAVQDNQRLFHDLGITSSFFGVCCTPKAASGPLEFPGMLRRNHHVFKPPKIMMIP